MRRLFTILAVILSLLVVGVGGYFYFFSSPAEITTVPGGSLPVAGQGELPDFSVNENPASLENPVPVSLRLVKISSGPVVPGSIAINKAGTASSSAQTIASFIERSSGNVFTYVVQTKTLSRTSNRTLPGIQSAKWLPDASLAFVRYLSGDDYGTINTYGLPANGANGFFLSQNLADVAVSSKELLTLASGVNGSSVSVGKTDGSKMTEVFSTPLSAAHVSFAGSKYLVYTKPTSSLEGFAFLADNRGTLSRVAGPFRGLVALASPSGRRVFVSHTDSGALYSTLVDVSTGESLALPVSTIADKCVWSADSTAIYCGVPKNPPRGASYPDDWYQGAVHFSDRLWKIDVESRYAQLILDFETETDSKLDVEDLSIDPLGTNVFFVNKNDGSFWNYSL